MLKNEIANETNLLNIECTKLMNRAREAYTIEFSDIYTSIFSFILQPRSFVENSYAYFRQIFNIGDNLLNNQNQIEDCLNL